MEIANYANYQRAINLSPFSYRRPLVEVALLLVGQVAAGVVSSISSLIPEVTAVLFFRKDKELRGTIESYHQHVLDSQRILTMIDVAETVKSGEERDSLKRQIIYKTLGIENNPPNNRVEATR